MIVCLLDYPSVDDVLRPAADGLGGRVVVNVTNGVPAQARDTGAWVTGAGAEYVDGSSVRLAVRCPRILGWCCGAIVGS